MERALTSVIPSLVGEGVFGPGEYSGLERDEDDGKGAQFASDVAFVALRVRRPNGTEEIPLVIKAQTGNKWMQDNMNLKGQFQNELSMYRHILPAIGTDQSWYPKFYHGFVSAEGTEEDLIVISKMREFRKSKEKIFLDYEHMSLAIKRIAEFHSLSYIRREENVDKFKEMSKKLKWVRPEDVGANNWQLYSLKKGLDAFSKKYGSHGIMDEFFDALAGGRLLEKLSAPEEPLFGVICHGDYCNNNIIYRYGGSGRPEECAFFDFQLSTYGSPAIDLAFYLYLHTAEETREEHWDGLLKLYWDTLRGRVPHGVAVPSYGEFLNHFAARAAYGYAICSFFVPVLLRFKDVKDFNNFEEGKFTTEEKSGDDEAENIVRGIVHHAFKRKYIHAFIDFMKDKK